MPRTRATKVTIETRVRAMRQARGWSQTQLAEAAGVTQASISRLENGLLNATLGTMARVAYVFGCEIGDLIGPPVPQSLRRVADDFLRLDQDRQKQAAEALRGLLLVQRSDVE